MPAAIEQRDLVAARARGLHEIPTHKHGSAQDEQVHTLSGSLDYNTPLVDGTAWMRSERETAWASARPKALNAASTIWWPFAPASLRMCSVIPALCATARK